MRIARMSAILLPLLLSWGSALAADPPAPTVANTDAAGVANMQLGISYMQQGQLGLARERLDRALQLAPRNADVRTAAAMLEERLGNRRKAEDHHRAAIRFGGPNRPDLTNNYAAFLCGSGRAKQGVRMFLEVAANKLYSTPYTAYTNAGVCARGDKRPDEAQRYFREALKLRPNHAEAVVQLVDLELSRNRLTEARTEVDQFLKTYLPTADVLLSCVQVTRAQKDRLAEERCARRLRKDFAGSDAERRLQAQP